MKHKLTEKTLNKGESTLYQIQAVKSFGNVASGALGGGIEKESNLPQEGNSGVSDNAETVISPLTWTPCKEALPPEERGYYLITDDLGRVVEALWFRFFKGNIWGFFELDGEEFITTSAWMPLPAPYVDLSKDPTE